MATVEGDESHARCALGNLEKAARPQAELAGVDVKPVLGVVPIGITDAVTILERAPGVDAQHALHEIDIEVDASPGYCAGHPNRR
jgi:hypothetical protein